MRLLQPNPDIKLARFHVAEDPAVDVIRGVRAFLSALRAHQFRRRRASFLPPQNAAKRRRRSPQRRPSGPIRSGRRIGPQ
jgi:hypothetical protein